MQYKDPRVIGQSEMMSMAKMKTMAALLSACYIFSLIICSAAAQAFCFEEAGKEHRISPELLKSIARVESGFNYKAVNKNRNGSRDLGLMQINSAWIDTLSLKRDELKKTREEFIKKSSVLNADIRREREKEMVRKEEDFRDQVQEKEEEMRKDEYNSMQPLLNDLFEVTTKVAKDEGFTLILEAKSGVVYFSKTIEITDKVIKLFNEGKIKKEKK